MPDDPRTTKAVDRPDFEPLIAPLTPLQKGPVSQLLSPGRVGKGLGVAKRYCRMDVIGDTFLQC